MTSKHESNVRKISEKPPGRFRDPGPRAAASFTLPCGYTYTQELITPEKAAEYLTVVDNRAMRESHAASLAHAMDAEKFLLTPASIYFDTDGHLIQGQHTLRAVILANRAVQLIVVRNVPKAVYSVLDCGLPRQMAERLHSDRVITSICQTLFRHMVRGGKSQHYEIQLVMEAFRDGLNAFRAAFSSRKVRGFTIAHHAAIVLRIARDLKEEDADSVLRVQRYLERIAESDITNLPAVLKSFYLQFAERAVLDLGVAPSSDQFCRAWIAFDPEHSAMQTLRINDHREVILCARKAFSEVTCGVFE